jgi:hypothetical protein
MREPEGTAIERHPRWPSPLCDNPALAFSKPQARKPSGPRARRRNLGPEEDYSDRHRFPNRPVTAQRQRVVSLVTHADIPEIVWADDETGCYGVRGRDAKGNRIVVERSVPIKIVSAMR